MSITGSGTLVAIGSDALLHADPTDPFPLAAVPLDQRATIAAAWRMPADQCSDRLFRAAIREATSPDVLARAVVRSGVVLKQIATAWLSVPPVTLATMRPAFAQAPQSERDTVWKDAALMATARRVLPTDDYLGMLPLLRVLAPPTGGGVANNWGGFDLTKLGPMVDDVIRKYLGAYVRGGAGKVVGEMSVVGVVDWDMAFHRQWKRVTLQGCLNTAFAFVDVNQPGRHIWIHNDRGSPGTAIHEGIHKYASPVVRDELINAYRGGGDDVCNLDEGATEYFTRLAIDNGSLGYARGELRQSDRFGHQARRSSRPGRARQGLLRRRLPRAQA